MKRRGHYRRGYPVAVLIGFERNRAVLWQVFSNVVKPHAVVEYDGRREDDTASYNFHESIVDALRAVLKEGVRSVVLTAPMRTDYSKRFLDHVRKHHAWLTQSKGLSTATFSELVGSAGELHEVADLVKTKGFRQLIGETTEREADHIVDALEKRLASISDEAIVLFSLKEIEDLICGEWKSDKPRPEYLVLTDKFLADNREKSRVQRLLQISKNRNVRTRIVKAETAAGRRLMQLGGIACFTEPG